MPCTRCARRKRPHRQGRARAGAAPQRGVGRPPPAPRGDGGACCAIRRRAGCCGGGGCGGARRQGRCGTAAGSAAELGRYLVPFGATFGISLSWTERLLLVRRLSLWPSCCCCCLLPRSGSIAAVQNIRRRVAASLQPSSTDQERQGYVALATLLNRLLCLSVWLTLSG